MRTVPATTKQRTTFACSECGHESPKWLGRCPGCTSWNTFVEHAPAPRTRSANGSPATAAAVELAHLPDDDQARLPSGVSEFDRVLGGGIVPARSSSSAATPASANRPSSFRLRPPSPTAARVLYVSGEESATQLKLRCARLGLSGSGLFVLPETSLELAFRQRGGARSPPCWSSIPSRPSTPKRLRRRPAASPSSASARWS